ncbi:hypothetical protein GEMRC1_014046 [Eukaryota sp. GEM-RC1]
MSRRKKIVLRPFCYYCNRIFHDESVLLNHQRARHFKCTVCKKKTQNAPGLKKHYDQQHREKLTRVPHSLKSRGTDPDIRIVAMDGVPGDIKHPLDDGSKRIRRRLGGFDPSTMQLPLPVQQPTIQSDSVHPLLSVPMQSSTMARKVAATVPTYVATKEPNTFLVYGDLELQMEERKAELPKYRVVA